MPCHPHADPTDHGPSRIRIRRFMSIASRNGLAPNFLLFLCYGQPGSFGVGMPANGRRSDERQVTDRPPVAAVGCRALGLLVEAARVSANCR